MNRETGRQQRRQTGKKGQSGGQIDRWVTYLFGKRRDRRASKQTGRQMYKLGGKKKRERWTRRHMDALGKKAGSLCNCGDRNV